LINYNKSDHNNEYDKKRKKLFSGTVPENNTLFSGTVPENKTLISRTLPENKVLFSGTCSGK
jgi:hypothetical protein